MKRITGIRLYLLETPMRAAYVSSLGALASIRSVMAHVFAEDGTEAASEVTPVRGYNEETTEQVWDCCIQQAGPLRGLALEEARERLAALALARPYGCSPLLAAVEQCMAGEAFRLVPERHSVPIVGAVLGRTPAAVKKEVPQLLDAGFRTLKVKAGMRFAEDAERIGLVQRLAVPRAVIRIDFNGAYDAAEALRFLGGLDHAGIALAEQPCPAGDWQANEKVARECGLPVMLDESVSSVADVRRAGAAGCFAFVKLKLGKLPGLRLLDEAYAAAAQARMSVVIGNGAATDVACRLEALVAARHPEIAGEMNGFLKNGAHYLLRPLRFEHGGIVLDEAGPALDEEALARRSVRRAIYSA